MSTSTIASSTRQHAAWVTPPDEATPPTKIRATFARLRERFGTVYDSAWALSLQPEHLLAYATWSETLSNADGVSVSPREGE